MASIPRVLTRNFWYERAMRWTIYGQMRRRARLPRTMVAAIGRRERALRLRYRGMVEDSLSEFHLSWCAMIAAVYEEALAAGSTAEGARELAEKVIFENMNPEGTARTTKATLDRARDPFAAMVELSKDQELRFFGRTFSFVRERDDDAEYTLRVTRCFYLDFFEAIGHRELMAIACAWDMISWSAGIDPATHGLRFSRPATLGLDGRDCEFRFARAERGGDAAPRRG